MARHGEAWPLLAFLSLQMPCVEGGARDSYLLGENVTRSYRTLCGSS